MAYDIGPKIGIDGEAEFRRELNEIKTGIKTLGSEMKLTNLEFEDNADSMEALSAKGDVLLRTYQEQEKYLDKTKTALAEAKKKYGENSTEVQKWQKAVYEAEAELKKTEKQLKETTDAMEDLGKDTEGAEEAVEDLGDAAEKSNKGLKGIAEAAGDVAKAGGRAAKGLGSVATVVAGNLISGAVSGIAGAVADVAKTVWDLDEATEEYRVAMGKLDTAFESAGYSTETAKETYTEFYKILGDTDTATEASQLLAKLALNQEDLSTWTDIAAGVMGTFGDSLPIEGLIEAANETAKTGDITGVLADALNWAGIAEDDFQAKLDACSDESERNRLIMETLSETYDDATDIFYANNEEVIRSRENQAKLDEATGRLGESISGLKNTLLEQFGPAIADAANWLADLADTAAENVNPAIDGIIKKSKETVSAFKEEFAPELDLLEEELGEWSDMITDDVIPVIDGLKSKAGEAFDGVDEIWGDIMHSAAQRSVEKLAKIRENIEAVTTALKNMLGVSDRGTAGFGEGSTGGSFGGTQTSAKTAAAAKVSSGTSGNVYLDGTKVGQVLRATARKNDADGADLW